MQYRREIDGLRAVAVLPVIAFHSGAGFLTGGFVGVDIFFVISGYLITSILLADLDRGQYSISRFYERRARRILPALFAMMAVCVPAAWLLMLPDQFDEFGKSIVSVVLFCSNIFFWMQTGYFSGHAELKPLLHTWSLSVEEQFYLAFPVLLALIHRFGQRIVIGALLVSAGASLSLSEWASVHAESANFYLIPTRAWELLVGSLCAMQPVRPAPPSPRRAQIDAVLSLGGLALIIGAITTFDDQMRFPGLAALVPVGGTALIILYGRAGTPTARLLSLSPLVGIGLISYSAYLWHQPLFAFARLASLTEPPPAVMLGLSLASLAIAAVSWRFVEQPFRSAGGSIINSRARVFAASGVAGGVLAGIGGAVAMLSPPTFIERAHPAVAVALSERAYEPQGAYGDCPGFLNSDAATCRRLGDGPRRIVIWGDSHAHALSAGARAVPGYSVFFMGHWGCPPLLGVARQDRFGNFFNCETTAALQPYADYVAGLAPQDVFVVARWTIYTNGRHMQSKLQRDTHFVTDGRTDFDGAGSSRAVMIAGVARTVDWLRARGIRVHLVEQVPDLHDYSPRGIALLADAPRAAISAWHAPERRLFAEAIRHGAMAVPTHDLFCSGDRCRLRRDGVPLYLDDNHVNYHGATPIYDRIVGTADRSR